MYGETGWGSPQADEAIQLSGHGWLGKTKPGTRENYRSNARRRSGRDVGDQDARRQHDSAGEIYNTYITRQCR